MSAATSAQSPVQRSEGLLKIRPNKSARNETTTNAIGKCTNAGCSGGICPSFKHDPGADESGNHRSCNANDRGNSCESNLNESVLLQTYYFMMTPHAIRSPALPAGSVFISSAFA